MTYVRYQNFNYEVVNQFNIRIGIFICKKRDYLKYFK